MAGYTLEQLKEMHGEGGFTIVNSPTTTQVQQQPQQQGGGLTREQVMALGGTIVGEDTQPVKPIEPKKSLGTKILGDGAVGKTVKAIPGIIEKGRGNFQDMASKYQSSKITAPEFGLQILGNAAGVLTDVVGKGIDETVKAIGETPMSKGTDTLGERFGRGLKRIGNTPISQGTDTLGQRLGRGVSNIIGSQPIQAGVQAVEANPRLKANLQAVGNIASVIPAERALGLATKGAKNTVRALKPTDELLAGASRVGQQVKAGSKFVGSKVLGKSSNKATDLLKATEETMTMAQKKQAVDSGRQIVKRGFVDYAPSETEKMAGEILKGKLSKNQVKNVPIIKKEIAERGRAAEQYLEKNSLPISNDEYFKAFEDGIKEDIRYMTPSQKKAYKELTDIFQNELHGRGGYNTDNTYKALKEFEEGVTENLPKGKEALLADNLAGSRLQAAARVRQVARDLIGSKHPGEFQKQMFELASLYDVKNTVITKAIKTAKTPLGRLAQRNPTAAKIVKYAVPATAVGIIGNKLLGK